MAPSRFLPRLDYPAHLRSAEGAGRNSKHQQIAPLRRLVPSLRRNRCELRHFRKHFDGSLFPAESIVAAENGAVEMTARPTIGGCPDRAGTIFSPGFFAPHSNWPLAFAEINQCECESRGEPIYPRLLLILAMVPTQRCSLSAAAHSGGSLGLHRRYIARATGDNDYNYPGDGPIA
jgi:hypothetical protein